MSSTVSTEKMFPLHTQGTLYTEKELQDITHRSGSRELLENILLQRLMHGTLHLDKFVVSNAYDITGPPQVKLGEGAVSIAYNTSTPGFAVKLTRQEKASEDIYASTVLDIAVMHYLNHPGIMNIIGVQLNPLIMILPEAIGSLTKYSLQKHEYPCVFYQIFRGLAYCHSKYIWHRDIKPDNILLFGQTDFPQVKISDFGICSIYSRPFNNATWVGSRYWQAPEIALGDGTYDETVDVWAAGVMLLDRFRNKYTFASRNTRELLERIFVYIGLPTSARLRSFVQDQYSSEYVEGLRNQIFQNGLRLSTVLINEVREREAMDVISRCIAWPQYRQTASEILELSYFRNVKARVEKMYPAKPAIKRPCGDVMLEDENKSRRHNIDTAERSRVFQYVYDRVQDKSRRIIFYTYALFDYCLDMHPDINKREYLPMIIACYTVGAKIYDLDSEEDVVKKFNMDPEGVAALRKNLAVLLKKVDFEIIFPTVYDFIYHYGEAESVDKGVVKFAYDITDDYISVTEYLPSEIAGMAYDADRKDSECVDPETLPAVVSVTANGELEFREN